MAASPLADAARALGIRLIDDVKDAVHDWVLAVRREGPASAAEGGGGSDVDAPPVKRTRRAAAQSGAVDGHDSAEARRPRRVLVVASALRVVALHERMGASLKQEVRARGADHHHLCSHLHPLQPPGLHLVFTLAGGEAHSLELPRAHRAVEAWRDAADSRGGTALLCSAPVLRALAARAGRGDAQARQVIECMWQHTTAAWVDTTGTEGREPLESLLPAALAQRAVVVRGVCPRARRRETLLTRCYERRGRGPAARGACVPAHGQQLQHGGVGAVRTAGGPALAAPPPPPVARCLTSCPVPQRSLLAALEPQGGDTAPVAAASSGLAWQCALHPAVLRQSAERAVQLGEAGAGKAAKKQCKRWGVRTGGEAVARARDVQARCSTSTSDWAVRRSLCPPPVFPAHSLVRRRSRTRPYCTARWRRRRRH